MSISQGSFVVWTGKEWELQCDCGEHTKLGPDLPYQTEPCLKCGRAWRMMDNELELEEAK